MPLKKTHIRIHTYICIQIDIQFLKWGLWRKEINSKEKDSHKDHLYTKNLCFVGDIQKNTHESEGKISSRKIEDIAI